MQAFTIHTALFTYIFPSALSYCTRITTSHLQLKHEEYSVFIQSPLKPAWWKSVCILPEEGLQDLVYSKDKSVNMSI